MLLALGSQQQWIAGWSLISQIHKKGWRFALKINSENIVDPDQASRVPSLSQHSFILEMQNDQGQTEGSL